MVVRLTCPECGGFAGEIFGSGTQAGGECVAASMCWECARRGDVPLDRCVHGDCADVLRDMPDRCVDLVLTDPPWGTSRLDFDSGGKPTVGVWREVKRVLKPDGWLACFGDDADVCRRFGGGHVRCVDVRLVKVVGAAESATAPAPGVHERAYPRIS